MRKKAKLGRPVKRYRCNCGNRGIGEYLIYNRGTAWTMYFCEECKPKRKTENIQLIYNIPK